MTDSGAFDRLVAEIGACEICAPYLPLGPSPIVRGRPSARLLIISQAPGRRVHDTRLSFNDRSGDRLRTWLAIDRATFYDAGLLAILGMAFCYPGSDHKGGDLPPRPECAPRWHARLRSFFRDRADPARRPLRYRLLPAGGPHPNHDRGDRALARFPAGTLRPAASELADNALVARQPVVRKRGLARAARPSSPGAIGVSHAETGSFTRDIGCRYARPLPIAAPSLYSR